MTAKQILKMVYEESLKIPCADVDKIAVQVLNEVEETEGELSFEEETEFWGLLTAEDTTYLDELDYRFFFEYVVIE